MSDIRTTTPEPVAAAAVHWARQLARQWWYLQWLKLAGISAFMAVFFSAYFALLNRPLQTIIVMPLTALDGWIGFQPSALWVYVSLWVYVGITPACLPSLRALLAYGVWASALCLSGLLCFFLWPSAVPLQVHQLDPDVAQHPGFALLRGVDAAGNACPSLHVASAVFSACWIHRLLASLQAPAWPKVVNVLWCLLIAWSTVAVRQHVVLDVLAGAALGAVFGVLSGRWRPAVEVGAAGQPLSLSRYRH